MKSTTMMRRLLLVTAAASLCFGQGPGDQALLDEYCVTCHSANSTLKTRLYRHLVTEETQRLGFANSIILTSSYMPGVTRHPLLDTLILLAFGVTLLGLLAHGLGRIIGGIIRRRKNHG